MLERMRIKSFQAHHKLDLVFDPTVTTIVGPTDSGKSSVIRALRWLMLNRPQGSSFIRNGEKKVEVKLKLDGSTIRRGKKTSENSYSINGKEFKAFGADVPEEIVALQRVDDVNFQNQHDAPFWFSLSAGEVAKRLNTIINLDVIDCFMAAMASEVKRIKIRYDDEIDRFNQYVAKKDELAWVPDFCQDVSDLKVMEDRRDTNMEMAVGLGRLFDGVSQQQNLFNHKASEVADVSTLLSKAKVAVQSRSKTAAMDQLLSEILTAEEIAVQEVPDVLALELSVEEALNSRNELDRLADLMEAICEAMSVRADLLDEALMALERMSEETEGQCPICGGVLG